ncbi:MAG TPA: hypothetical protein VK553_08540 [Candidatus Nitrosopolaris rasttigaisensis]|nr:hypothetical protein [Candidatus Nitrosopolaris rasttigaisensis]
MEMTTSQQKPDNSEQVEKPSSGKGDGETKRSFSPTRRASEIISGVEKLEGQVADQKERWVPLHYSEVNGMKLQESKGL